MFEEPVFSSSVINKYHNYEREPSECVKGAQSLLGDGPRGSWDITACGICSGWGSELRINETISVSRVQFLVKPIPDWIDDHEDMSHCQDTEDPHINEECIQDREMAVDRTFVDDYATGNHLGAAIKALYHKRIVSKFSKMIMDPGKLSACPSAIEM